MHVSLDGGRSPVTVDLVGGDSAELFLLDGRGVADRCVDLDAATADPAVPLPPGTYG